MDVARQFLFKILPFAPSILTNFIKRFQALLIMFLNKWYCIVESLLKTRPYVNFVNKTKD